MPCVKLCIIKIQSANGSLGDTRRADKAGAVGEADCDGGEAA